MKNVNDLASGLALIIGLRGHFEEIIVSRFKLSVVQAGSGGSQTRLGCFNEV